MPRINNIIDNINIDKVAKRLSKFQDPTNILPTALIEATVTAGRSYRGYKRGGKDELRERLIEESTCGLIWLFGAKKLNDLGDWIGKKFFKLGDLSLDIGKDALRDPFANVEPALKKATGAFKTVKIFSSVIITTTFIGFVLPKIKQSITKKIKEKEKENRERLISATLEKSIECNMQKFIEKTKPVAFKGGMSLFLTAAHNIENKNIWRLLSTDTGILAGRALSARNKDEAKEYVFRDAASSYCYMFAAPNIIWLLNKIFKNKNIHPEALLSLRDNLKDKLQDGVNIEDFKNNTFKKTDLPEIFNSIKFKRDVVELESLREILPADLFEKAEKLSELQPKNNGKTLLTSLQVKDIFSTSWLSKPELLKDATSKATWGASINSKKFVPKKKIDKIRQSLDDFTESLYNYAKKKGLSSIDNLTFERFAKKNILKTSTFTIVGTGIAVFALAWLIPKLQYLLTKKRTGSDTNPALKEFQGSKKA